MPRRVIGPLPARECVCIAAFYSPDVARELRRRARREGVGAGRIASRIVSDAVSRARRHQNHDLLVICQIISKANEWANPYPWEETNMPPTDSRPTNREIRDYLVAHFDRDGLELLVADTVELIPPKLNLGKIRLEMIASRDSGLPNLALKITDWFEMRGLTHYLLGAIRATPAGHGFAI